MLQRFKASALVGVVFLALFFFSPAETRAQQPTTPWAAEVNLGWNPSVSGNVISSAIGVIGGQPVVLQDTSFGDVYGTGVLWRFGAGYMLNEYAEILGSLTYQSVSADAVEAGSVGGGPLFATFDDYQATTFEGGYRYYFAEQSEQIRPYASGTAGIAIINEIDAAFASSGGVLQATDFYDGTAAFTFSLNGGVWYGVTERFDVGGQLGLKYLSGLTDIDALEDTALDPINDESGRWTFPITVGARFRF
jgi:hypothetical protein